MKVPERDDSHPTDLDLADRSAMRLWLGLVLSLLLNAFLFYAFGNALLHRQSTPPAPIEISRVIITKQGRTIHQIVSRKQIERKVQHIRRQIVRQQRQRVTHRPVRPQPERPRVVSKPLESPRPDAPQAPDVPHNPKSAPPHPQGAHHQTLTAQNPAAPNAGHVKAGGNADVGHPTDAQNFGNSKTNPDNYTPPASQPQPTEAPASPPTPIPPANGPTLTPSPTPTPTPTPTLRPTPTPEPTPTPSPRPTPTPVPTPTPTPRLKGPTREAKLIREIKPVIPDELKDSSFKSSVRVRVEVNADGSFSPSLRSSSGNAAIDARVLATLQRWRWEPALKDGNPVASTQYVRVDIEVR